MQRAVAGLAAQRHHRAHQPVDVLPDELLERFGVAPARHIVGDPRGDFGDAREIPDRVVARRAVRIAEMKEVELSHPPGALGLGVDAAKHVGVALRVEHDDGFPAPNVLRHQAVPETATCRCGWSRPPPCVPPAPPAAGRRHASSGSTPWSAGSPPTSGIGATGFHRAGRRVNAVAHASPVCSCRNSNRRARR